MMTVWFGWQPKAVGSLTTLSSPVSRHVPVIEPVCEQLIVLGEMDDDVCGEVALVDIVLGPTKLATPGGDSSHDGHQHRARVAPECDGGE
jgi:hypothetical protein